MRFVLIYQITKNDELALEDDEEDEDFKNIVLFSFKMLINVRFNDLMEVIVIKICLEVFNNLVKVGSRGIFLLNLRLENMKMDCLNCKIYFNILFVIIL